MRRARMLIALTVVVGLLAGVSAAVLAAQNDVAAVEKRTAEAGVPGG